MSELTVREAVQAHEDAVNFPYGPPVDREHFAEVGTACVLLCEGDVNRGRTLWKLVVEDCGGSYMPAAAALALLRAAHTTNIVPDVAPDPTSDIG